MAYPWVVADSPSGAPYDPIPERSIRLIYVNQENFRQSFSRDLINSEVAAPAVASDFGVTEDWTARQKELAVALGALVIAFSGLEESLHDGILAMSSALDMATVLIAADQGLRML